MNRDELLQTKCWSCWWREGAHCFSDDFGEIPKQVNSVHLKGHDITKEHIKRCAKSYVSKRTMLGSTIPDDKLIILSEHAKK